MAKRWQERYGQYQKALKQLTRAVSQREYSELERAGLIQIFEYTFELGWKTAQDYCLELGYVVHSPREAIQQSIQADLISEGDGYEWLDGFKDRNLLAHTYDEQRSLDAEQLIRQRYYPLLERLSTRFNEIV